MAKKTKNKKFWDAMNKLRHDIEKEQAKFSIIQTKFMDLQEDYEDQIKIFGNMWERFWKAVEEAETMEKENERKNSK